MPSDDLWDGAEIISAYTRRQAIEDGVLVQHARLEHKHHARECLPIRDPRPSAQG